MKQLDHIGIAVDNLENSIATYEKLLNTQCYKREVVEQQEVDTAFFRSGESKIELLGATAASSIIRKFIDTRGEGMHHMAFEVEDIDMEMKRLQAEGFKLLSDKPIVGADNKRVAFVHPKDGSGVLVELCQSVKNNRST